MESSQKPVQPVDSHPTPPEEAAPASERRAIARDEETPSVGRETSARQISPEQLRAYLALPEIQKRIMTVVRATLKDGPAAHLAEDIAQEANVAMLSAKSRPRAMDTAFGWVSMAARRAVVHSFRRRKIENAWLVPDGDIDEYPSRRPPPPADEWMISRWLARVVRDNATDQETFELLVYKARSEKTYEQVASEHGMTGVALRSRVWTFRNKYQPRWVRWKRALELLLLLGAVAIAVLLWLFSRPKHAEIRPDPTPAVPSIAPTTTATAKEPVFEPSKPTPRPPRRDVPEKP
jgi:DNA-directed RNA polymerase specialized sigma24 family protein